MPGKTRRQNLPPSCPRSFNEAPAKCRGKPAANGGLIEALKRFNEAPAKCRGKRGTAFRWPALPPASMRPQRNAGENQTEIDDRIAGRCRFNEAPAKCRGKPFRAEDQFSGGGALQ